MIKTESTNYSIEKMNKSNANYYAFINARSWSQSYRGIVNDDFLDLINTQDELLNIGFDSMIVGCLQKNPSNDFYKHMGGILIDESPLTLPNGQELIENLYLFKDIKSLNI